MSQPREDQTTSLFGGPPGAPLRDGEVVPLDEALAAGSTRRDFCRAAIAGAALVTISGCGSGNPARVSVGGIDDDTGLPGQTNADLGGAGPRDLSARGPVDMAIEPGTHPDLVMAPTPPDLATSPPDLAQGNLGNCPNGVFDTGHKAATIAVNSAVYLQSQDAFLCRDASGWFAVSSICTHAGCTNNFSNGGFRCPCHRATFTLQGAVTGGPTNTPLDHYLICQTNTGNVGIDANTTVSSATRYMF